MIFWENASPIQRVILLAVSLGIGGTPATSLASNAPSGFGVGATQFAKEPVVSSRLDLNAEWKSEGERFPSREVRLNSFFESGEEGDHSFDVPEALIRIRTSGNSSLRHLWVGRALPFKEDALGTSESPTSAIGTSWVQNQSNALDPSLVGWIGAGWGGNLNKNLNFNVAMSPVFLPSFGPRLDLSETTSADGSRFAKLPPAYIRNNGDLIPLRYRVNTGDLAQIVLQYQYYVSLSGASSIGNFTALAWSAPKPSPETDTSAALLLDEDHGEIDVLAIAKPRFPRERFFGAKWSAPGSFSRVVAEGLYESTSGRWITSLEFRPLRTVSLGVLETFNGVTADPSIPTSAPYGKDLFWCQWRTKVLRERLVPSVRWEHHWTPGNAGDWLSPGVEYLPEEQLAVFGSVNVLVGEDGSYFGHWRALDSMAMGVRFQW